MPNIFFIDQATLTSTTASTNVVTSLVYHTNYDPSKITTTKAALITLITNSINSGIKTRCQTKNGVPIYIINSTYLRCDKNTAYNTDRVPNLKIV
jgi:hypothetical protein